MEGQQLPPGLGLGGEGPTQMSILKASLQRAEQGAGGNRQKHPNKGRAGQASCNDSGSRSTEPRATPPPKGNRKERRKSEAGHTPAPSGLNTQAGEPPSSAKKTNKARTKKARFKEHWSKEQLQRGIKRGSVFVSSYRCNANNSREGFVNIPGLPCDVLIKGLSNQNRAVVGDEVAVLLLPREEWYEVHSQAQGVEQETEQEDGEAEAEEGEDNSAEDTSNTTRPEDVLAEMSSFLLNNPSKRPTGQVVAIVQGSSRRERVIGSLMSEANGVAVLMPSDPRLPKMMVKVHTLPDALRDSLLEDCRKEAGSAHQLVSARIVEWAASNLNPLAQVRESLGQAGEIETETAAILAGEGIEEADFSQDVLACLPATPWKIEPEEISKRRDLRGSRIFTIDPLTARDLDDALSVEPLPNGLLRFGVHIADVGHFVSPETALDLEASERSTSVYLVQRVLPMLPHLLCQELCSLNPGVDRLAFSAIWEMTPDGEIVKEWFGRTVIRSCVKLAYEHAQRMIDGDYTARGEGEEPIPCDLQEPHKWPEVVEDVMRLYAMSRRLRSRRYDSGALRLDNTKLSFRLNSDGNPESAAPYVQREANQMIEEFMLLANRRVALFISEAFPERAVLRRHPPPDTQQLVKLEENMAKMGIQIDISSSGGLHKSLVALREELGTAQADVIIQQATKPMKLAEYFCTGTCQDDPESWRHYALAMSHYTHFTSPIRRYPDVLVHRQLAAALDAQATSLPMVEAAAKHKLRTCDDTANTTKHANARKLAAKNAQDASLKVYLCVMLRAHPVIHTATLLPIGGNQFFCAYVAALGVEVRVQVSEIHGCKGAEFNKATKAMRLLAGAPGQRARPKDAFGGFAYGLEAVANPEGLRPLTLPLELTALKGVPVVLSSELSGSGRPSTVVAKLYVTAQQPLTA